MPATQQQIDDLQAALDALAVIIHQNSIDLADTFAAIEEADEVMKGIEAQAMKAALNARFEVNQKLQYTNSEQRETAVAETVDADQTYQQYKTAKIALVELNAGHKADLEKNRNLHKSKLLVLQYYANLP